MYTENCFYPGNELSWRVSIILTNKVFSAASRVDFMVVNCRFTETCYLRGLWAGLGIMVAALIISFVNEYKHVCIFAEVHGYYIDDCKKRYYSYDT